MDIVSWVQNGLMSVFFGLIAALIFEKVTLQVLKFFLVYTIVQERTCHVYTLFGKIVLVLESPGLHFPLAKLTWRALLIGFLGRMYMIDMRMDQKYLRSQPVNSEEGAPMGIGVWYEMFISDPTEFLFRNTDPQGSLAANVSNATVRTLSNLPLDRLLQDRHTLSQAVRTEVTDKSKEWGYRIGSVYIRKVHFRDHNMIREIESKVVNRLRQVTATIKQDGANKVHIIRSQADSTASIEFGKASAVRPQIVGNALKEISRDPEVAHALFEILETKKILESDAELSFVPAQGSVLSDLIVSKS